MNYKDYYSVMGVDKSASIDEIKRAYKKLARKFHPDVSREEHAEMHFKEVSEAYEVLRDKQKRAAYDQLGQNWQGNQSGFTPPPNWQAQYQRSDSPFSQEGHDDFSDFFESLFGRGYSNGRSSHSHQPLRGQDGHAQVLIDLRDAYNGVTRSFTISSQGADIQGQPPLTNRTLKVSIPKGIKSGQKIRLKSQGQPGDGGVNNGDLYVEVGFNNHPLFTVDGATVTTEVTITPWQAAHGDKVNVPTPAGNIELHIPKRINSGCKLRVKGLGIPSKVPGDLFVKVKIGFPKDLTEQEEKLYGSLKAIALSQNEKMSQGLNA